MTLLEPRVDDDGPDSSDRHPAARVAIASRRWTVLPRRAAALWWVTPLGSLLLVVPLSLIVALQIPDTDYRVFYNAPRAIGAPQAALFLAGAGVLAIGALLPLAARVRPVRLDWPRQDAGQLRVLRRAETLAFRLTALGYLLLGGLGFARGATPSILLNAIVTQDNYSGQLKTLFAPVAGVTSLTQLGIAYVVLAGLLLTHGRSWTVVRRLIIVLVLGLLRSYLLTERLALLELVVPLVAIGAAYLRRKRDRGRWLPFVPLLALPVLLVVFGAFEYSRSWQYFRTRTTQSFPLFIVNRLAGYYATSYNNGALQLAHNTDPGRLPYASIEALWTAPGPAQLDLYQRLTGQGGDDLLNTTLSQYGSPEFNNPGGLAVPFIDFGTVYGLVFFAIVGVLIGYAYRSWRAGNPTGLLLYPVIFTGLLELPRYLYWTQGRVFPAFVYLGVTAYLMTRGDIGRSLWRRRVASLVGR